MTAWKKSKGSAPEAFPAAVQRFICDALDEDLGSGDITSRAVIQPKSVSRSNIVAKQALVVAGLPFAQEVFRCLDWKVLFEPKVQEGRKVRTGTVLATVSGKTSSILAGERTALNLLQRLSGVATLTAQFVRKVALTKAKILDTRKTTPGMRYMEKYAVRMGGGLNHRMGLYDSILIKDNHILAAGGIVQAVRLAKKARPKKSIEVECESLYEVEEAIKAKADIIMLDNMSLADMRRAVKLAKGGPLVEASGSVRLKNVRQIADTGVDFISVGALTHSAPAVDISLEF